MILYYKNHHRGVLQLTETENAFTVSGKLDSKMKESS
jgi:hypothetical protein